MGTGFNFFVGSPTSDDNDRLRGVEDFINVSRQFVRVVNSILTEDGIREDSWRVLRLLSRSHGVSMGEIALHISLPTTSTTRLVDDLVDEALVFRRPSSDDGRKALVHLSRDGAERLQRIDAMLSARMPELERIMPGVDWRALSAALS
ncbi:MarR family winged helix-turn-helix transcriptional regulator [Rhodococcus koreensis]